MFARVACLSLVLTATAVSQYNCSTTPATNEHLFFNEAHTSFSTRATTDEVDQIYFLQPTVFRRTPGDGTGWRVALQDADQSTSEEIRLSWHPLQRPLQIPSPTPLASARFTLFGSGFGEKAMEFRLTTATPTALQEYTALGIELPAPRKWVVVPQDALTIHYQRADRLQVTPAKRERFAFKRNNTRVVPGWESNGQGRGATFHLAGLYDRPVLQVFNASNAYGQTEDLFGPEALQFESGATTGRQDAVGFRIAAGSEYATTGTRVGLGAIFFATQYRTPALPFGAFGSFLIDENRAFALTFYVPLDDTGEGRSAPIPHRQGANLAAAWQAVLIVTDTARSEVECIELSNAVFSRLP